MPGLWLEICPLAARFRYYVAALIFHCDRAHAQSRKPFFRVFTETGPLIALAVAIALLVGDRRDRPRRSSSISADRRGAQQRRQPQRWRRRLVRRRLVRAVPAAGAASASSRIFPRRRRRRSVTTVPERNVLVLGDGMADWLAYGLEDAYAEQPDMGVIRKAQERLRPDQISAQGRSGRLGRRRQGHPRHREARRHRGHARPQRPRRDARAGGREIRRRQAADKKADKKDARAKPDAKPAMPNPARSRTADRCAAKPDDKPVDTELPPDDAADNADAPPIIAPEKSARSPNGVYEFREERWVELYTKKIEEMIARPEVQGRAGAVGRPARDPRRQGNGGHAVPGFAVSRRRRQGRHHLCRRLGRLCRRSRPLPAEGPGLRRPAPPAAFL